MLLADLSCCMWREVGNVEIVKYIMRKMQKFVRTKREDVKKAVLLWNQTLENRVGPGQGLFTEGRLDCYHGIPFRQRQAYLAFIYDIYHLRYLIEKADTDKTKKRLQDTMKKRGLVQKGLTDSYKKVSNDEFGDNYQSKRKDHQGNGNHVSYRGHLPELLIGLKDRITARRVTEAQLLTALERDAGHMINHNSRKKGRKWSLMLEDGADQVSKKVKTEDILTGKIQSKFAFQIEENTLVALGLMLTENWNPLK